MKLLSKLLAIIFLIISNDAYGKDLVLSLKADRASQKRIYQNYVTRTGLHKTKPDTYHVTVAWVKNVNAKDYPGLKKFLERRLAHYKRKTISFQPSYADHYLVGGRTPARSPIVMYPNRKCTQRLKMINQWLLKDLHTYRGPSGKKYTFSQEVMPGTYKPHVTLANTSHLMANHVDKRNALKVINRKIKRQRNAALTFK